MVYITKLFFNDYLRKLDFFSILLYNTMPCEGEKIMLVNHKILENLCKDAGEKRVQKAKKYK